MKLHYFQRYHTKENVATANTMLLLSRLYHYSTTKFFQFLKSEYFLDAFEPEIVFRLQEKNLDSVPDATITQESFKIVVETKLSDWFYEEQLVNHLKSFGDVKHKVLITIAPEFMKQDKRNLIEKKIRENKENGSSPVIHINTTFEELTNAIQDVIDDRDYEMKEVLDDYLEYCYNDGLISGADSWKYMRMQLAGATFAFNMSENLYYDKSERKFRAHDYLGLYLKKSVRAIGKICARITAVETENGMVYEAEYGVLTKERTEAILRAIADSTKYGYDLKTVKHRYFFVEKFYEMDFKKITPRPPMGARVFDLQQILGRNEMPEVSQIAKMLSEKTWE